MSSFIELKALEELIKPIASKYGGTTGLYENYLHEGRIIAWEFVIEHNVTADNIDQYRDKIITELTRVIKRAKGVDAYGSMKEVSLDATFGPDNTGTLKDLLPSDGATPLEDLLRGEILNQEVTVTPQLLKELARSSLKECTTESKQVVVYLLVQLLGIEEDDVPKKVNYASFVDYGLQSWLWIFFNNSPFRAINCAYPGKFLPYHMACTPMRYWSGRGGRPRAAKALRLVLEETGVDPEDYPKLVTEKFLAEFKLLRPVLKLFKSHYNYLNAAYPNRYHPWELPATTPGFFENEENVVKAVYWMVEEKLHYPISILTVKEIWRQRIAQKITKEVFLQYGLRQIMAKYGSPEPVLRMVYPDKFLDWSFQTKKKWEGEEGKRLAARAVRWFVEDYLKANSSSVTITWSMFINNGFHGLITSKALGFNSSPRAALRNAYPECIRFID